MLLVFVVGVSPSNSNPDAVAVEIEVVEICALDMNRDCTTMVNDHLIWNFDQLECLATE